MDLARAFDTVAHPVLLKKMVHIGIRNKEFKLFESYLHRRTQQVLLLLLCRLLALLIGNLPAHHREGPACRDCSPGPS